MLLLLAGSIAALAGSWGLSSLSGFGPREWVFGLDPSGGPEVARVELELDLRHAPELHGIASLHGTSAGAGSQALDFLLNRKLHIDRVVEDGADIPWHSGPRLRSAYHGEARVVRVERALRSSDSSLRIEYSGRGLAGTEGQDWMGILLLAPDELRMSFQTAFYPEVEPDLDGPGVAPLPASVRVLAPEGFEVYVPGKLVESGPAEGGGTAWRFESERPTVLSLFAAPRVRRETSLGDARVVTLLRDEHAHLGEGLAQEARQVLETYAQLWGSIGARTLGVCEIDCRGDSYNWAAQGIVTIDRRAFDEAVPVAQLAHEIAHLWWGQEVVASGRGERFLTESLAEYAAWRYFAKVHGESRALQASDAARDTWLRSVHELGADPALADVAFSTPGYAELAYAKGPLALLAVERRIGREALDALLCEYRSAAHDGAALAGFVTALRKHAGEPAEVAPWIERAGHVHLALEAVSDDDHATRGSVRVEGCRAGCPDLVPTALEIGARWPDRHESIEISLGSASTGFEADWSPSPTLIELDPRALVLGERGTALYRGPARLVYTEPLDGAESVAPGPLSVRLRFASALGPPPEDAADRIQRASTDARLAAESDLPAVESAHLKDSRSFAVKSVRLDDDGRGLCIAIDRTAPDCRHTLVLPAGFPDADGLPLPEQRLSFTTRAGDPGSRPRVVSTEPASGARDVPASLERIRVVFSKPMGPAGVGFKTWRIAELEQKGWAFPKLGRSVWQDEHTLSLELAGPLDAGRGYGLPLDERYFDLAGNELIGFELTFTTSRQ